MPSIVLLRTLIQTLPSWAPWPVQLSTVRCVAEQTCRVRYLGSPLFRSRSQCPARREKSGFSTMMCPSNLPVLNLV